MKITWNQDMTVISILCVLSVIVCTYEPRSQKREPGAPKHIEVTHGGPAFCSFAINGVPYTVISQGADLYIFRGVSDLRTGEAISGFSGTIIGQIPLIEPDNIQRVGPPTATARPKLSTPDSEI